MKRGVARVALILTVVAGALSQSAQTRPALKIASISVDTAIRVVGPDGQTSINIYPNYGLSTLADEESTIFSPWTLWFQTDYLFFVPTRTTLNPNESGLVVLKASQAPSRWNPWALDYARDFGLYELRGQPGAQNGQLLLTASSHLTCPAGQFDPTFDLSYAAPGTVFLDPTNPWDLGGSGLLMLYEGTNRCVGIEGGKSNDKNNFYSTLGIATSADQGHTWPVYKANFTALPQVNPTAGPNAALGAYGQDVCVGNFCPNGSLFQPSSQYGRYAVSGAAIDAATANYMSSSSGLSDNTGDSEPSAFVDSVPGHDSSPYVYAVHTYYPGPFSDDSQLYPSFPLIKGDLSVSRAQLNAGRQRLQFKHWYNGKFDEPALPLNGVGGHESPILPPPVADIAHFQQCLAPTQRHTAGSISYSDRTHEYVLFFICTSPADPAQTSQCVASSGGDVCSNGRSSGGAWFYSTIDSDKYDLSHQDEWSAPAEVTNSWSGYLSVGCSMPDGANFAGWYPSLMSPGARPGHLSESGWVFFMNGCQGGQTPGNRAYSSRFFTMGAH